MQKRILIYGAGVIGSIDMVAPLGGVIYFDGGNNYTVSKNNMAIQKILSLAKSKGFELYEFRKLLKMKF